MTRICKTCGSEFATAHPNKVRCSKFCRNHRHKDPARKLKAKEWRERNKERLRPLQAKSQKRKNSQARQKTLKICGLENVHNCMICKSVQTQKALAIDHNHKTGEIRGLLCDKCNFGIGSLRDDPKLLQAAIDYLKGNMPRE